jgi:hypothetical protein
MAARYWVGGTGGWTDTARWSTTSGGAGGASVPTASDDVIINSNSGGPTITLATSQSCLTFTTTASCIIRPSTSGISLLVYGNVVLDSSTFFASASGNTVQLSIMDSATIDVAGISSRPNLRIEAGSGSVTLAQAYTTDRTITLISGTFSTNGYALAAETVTTSGTLARTLDITGSTISDITTFNMDSNTNLTVNATGSTIVFEMRDNRNFFGGGFTYGNLSLIFFDEREDTNDLVITGSNTFNTISKSGSNEGIINIIFSAGATNTMSRFLVSGSSDANVVVKSSVSGTQTTLIKDTPWLIGDNSFILRSINILPITGGGINRLTFIDVAGIPGLSSFLVMF